jgi:hypothetical protein
MDSKQTTFVIGSILGTAAMAALAAWSLKKVRLAKRNEKEMRAVDRSLDYGLVQSMEGSDAIAKY